MTNRPKDEAINDISNHSDTDGDFPRLNWRRKSPESSSIITKNQLALKISNYRETTQKLLVF